MTSLEPLLVSAIVALVGGIVALWRHNSMIQNARYEDQRESSRLVFALLQRISIYRGETPPPTVSTPQNPNYEEAKKLAARELNGQIEAMLRAYLETEPPPAPRKSRA